MHWVAADVSPCPEPAAIRTGRAALTPRYLEVRAHSLALAAPLSAEDQCIQSMPDASPTKWHLAHTTWFFETLLLQPHAGATNRTTRVSITFSIRTTKRLARAIRDPSAVC